MAFKWPINKVISKEYTSNGILNLRVWQTKNTCGIYIHTPVSHRKPSVKTKYKSHQSCIVYKLKKCTLYTNKKHKLKK